MTDEALEPITDGGFHNNLGRLLGGWSGWGADPRALADETLASVDISDDKEALIFTLTDGRTATYRAQGDCCSRSWIEHITVPPDIAGTTVETYGHRDMGHKWQEDDYEDIKVYETSFGTPRGEIIVEYRNSSNGYYGGWLDGPEEAWARDKIEAMRNDR